MWTLRLVVEYLRFILKAETPASLHSPFLYDLLPHAFDRNKAYYAFRNIEHTRQILAQSDLMIETADRGAGSKRRKNGSVGEFVRAALSSPRQCEILFRLVEKLKPKITIELGSALGISTAYLAQAYTSGQVYALEGNPLFGETAQNVIDDHCIHNVKFVIGDFDSTLGPTLERSGPVDFAFIDGNHRYQPTIAYFKQICEHASPEAVIVIDDIRWSPEMLRAWKAILDDPEVRISVDAFSFGLIFLGDRFKSREHHLVSPRLFDGGPVLG